MLLSVRGKKEKKKKTPSITAQLFTLVLFQSVFLVWLCFRHFPSLQRSFEGHCCELGRRCPSVSFLCFQTKVGFLSPPIGVRSLTIDSGGSAAPVIKKFYVEDGKHCSKPTVAGLFILNEISVEKLSNQPKESIVSLSFSLKCF